MNDGTIPQYPWSEGDTVFASALNGAIANTRKIGEVFVSDTPPTGAGDGSLWWDSSGTGLYVRYNDGSSTQWVVAENQVPSAGGITVVSVLDHGAKGDGTTDDTAAIQNVLNAYAGKATVFVPNTGNTFMTTGITLPSGTDLLLYGWIRLLPNSPAGVVSATNANTIILRGNGTIDGNLTAQATHPGGMAGLAVSNCTNVRVSGITVRDAYHWNLNITQSNDVVLDGVTVLDGNSANQFAAECNDCWLTNCMIRGPNLDYGFCFYGGVTNSGAIGNTVYNAGMAGSSAGSPGAAPGIGILSDNAASYTEPPCLNITIADNICYNNGGPGISSINPFGGFQRGIVITGNRCFNNNQIAGGSANADIFIDNTTDTIIIGNQSSSNGTSATTSTVGIFLGPNASHLGIFSNQIYNTGQGRTDGAGIWNDGANYVHFSSNYIYDNQTTPTMANAVVGTAGTHNAYVGNYFDRAFNIGLAVDTAVANVLAGVWNVGGSGMNIGGKGLSFYPMLTNAANDAAAAAAGVPVGGCYRNGSVMMIRTV